MPKKAKPKPTFFNLKPGAKTRVAWMKISTEEGQPDTVLEEYSDGEVIAIQPRVVTVKISLQDGTSSIGPIKFSRRTGLQYPAPKKATDYWKLIRDAA